MLLAPTPTMIENGDEVESSRNNDNEIKDMQSIMEDLTSRMTQITTKQVIWVNVDKSKGYAVDFLSISLHALSNNSEAYYVPCIYTQIETEGDNDNSNSDVQDLSSTREMRLIPIDPTQLDTLFQKICECAELNPYPNHKEACVILFKADQMEKHEVTNKRYDVL
ncbi:hypothetical protein P8452_30535 [Trifolium repens]|nr:hypothetical protein P8452_30535 [Trifolium repens]